MSSNVFKVVAALDKVVIPSYGVDLSKHFVLVAHVDEHNRALCYIINFVFAYFLIDRVPS
uniref:Uncharacterized protein n=1 Tax=Arundo donax TaxID=35708 RepID=A0A0A8YRS3_ARUDO